MIDLAKTVQFVEQSKGGAGKTVVATILGQYLKSKQPATYFYDTDANNKTFAGFKALEVERLNVLDDDSLVDQSKFDALLEKLANVDDVALTDTGSGEFLAIVNYMTSTEVVPILEDAGKEVIFNVPITFDQSEKDTFTCLTILLQNFPTAKFIIWKNEHHGEDKGNIDFKQLAKKCTNIIGFVEMPKLNAKLNGLDFQNMLLEKITFDEYITNPNNMIGNRTRMKKLKQHYFDQLDAIFISAE
ncbi:hypothetical protein [Acinetobacter baumannii]|uniref:hypothetical protein n=2 Tax=Acinetobacter baumannii TaxID=470 RepID=UPI0023401B7C|nr:hypothetical protein [Acinetobacter baumannii]MDC4147547.1 hypothetical protein [Acinetobacter baumannii]